MKNSFNLAPEQWTTLRRLLDDALALPAHQRDDWFESLTVDYAEFQPRLRALLSHADADQHPTVARLLETLPKIDTAQFARPPEADGTGLRPGATVGPYRLVRLLGEGGMGSVWLAERSDMLQRRQVALKLPRVLIGAAALAERMAREREILAGLNHPNIARLYDAGISADGQPFLALEYVEGERIDAYCTRKALSVPQRLRLFLQVARAVAHAHAQLVVHRDLKPANVLVTEAGDVRLLDFGIAKLLGDGIAQETALTRIAGRALTPEYAAPEQILGQPIGTAADIYSLGVMLCELLAGAKPYRLKRHSQAALEEAIIATEPARPSNLAADVNVKRRLRGDLDTIVLKALKKAPAERYATVAALAEDIERYLDDRPLLARPDSRAYRLRKFAARNRTAVVVGSGFVIALTVLTAFAVAQMFEARAERDVAERQRQRAIASNEFLHLLLEDAGAGEKPRTLTDVLDRSTALLEQQYAGNERAFAPMLYEASRRYATLGKVDRELQLLDRVQATARTTGDVDLLASAQCSAASALLDRDRFAAQARFDDASRVLTADGAKNSAASWICARAHAGLLEAQGDTRGAIALLRATIGSQEGRPPLPPSFEIALQSDLGHLLHKNDDVAGAAAAVARTIELLDQSGRGATMTKVVNLMNYASVLARAGELLAAAQDQERALALVSRVEGSGAPPPGFAGHYATSLLRLARYDEAIRLASEDAVRARAAGNMRMAAFSELVVARSLVKQRRFDEAEKALSRAEAGFSVNSQANARMLNEVELTRADGELLAGATTTARDRVISVLTRLNYPERRDASGLGSALHVGARVLLALNDNAGAERYAADAHAIALRTARAAPRSADVGQAALNRATALARLGRRTEAVDQATMAHTALVNGFGAEHPDTRTVEQLLTDLQSKSTASR